MRRHWRALGTIALVTIGAGMLSGCGLLSASTIEDSAVLPEDVTSVRLDSKNGDVTVRGADGATEVSVHRKVTYRGGPPDDQSYWVENGGVLVLTDCGWKCSVEYTVDLPAGVPVSGETSNGAIDLAGVGEVDVKTDNGAVTLDEVTGAVTVRTSNGRIDGRGLHGGPVEARSSNGAIDLTLVTPQDVRAEASNGAITVAVPDSGYRVSVRTSNGDTTIGVADHPAGAHRLDLRTDNGAITVNSA